MNQVNVGRDRPRDWVNIAFLGLTPVVGCAGTAYYMWNYGVTGLEIASFFFMWLLTGVGITCGYHRYYAHRTHECNRFVQFLYLIGGASAVQNSVINWASDHRYHHRYTDKNGDPYNIKEGGLYAHLGWITYKECRDPEVRFKNIPDLLKDPLVMWQHKYYLPIIALVSFGLPTLVGLMDGRPLGGLLWGGFLRVVIVHHMTFFINSLAHIVGTQPYSLDNTGRDNWFLGPFTFGEGYHNFHHKFQADYRNGVKWYAFDLGKWLLGVLSRIGWAWNLRRAPEALILKAKLEVDRRRVEARLASAQATDRMWEKVRVRMEAGCRRLEEAMSRYQAAKVEYRHRKDEWSREVRRQWAHMLEQHENELVEARARWQEFVRSMSRLPHPSARGVLNLAIIVDILKYRIF